MFARAKCNDYLCRVIKRLIRKDAGVVDRGGLENRCTLAGTQGSNPCLSAKRSCKSQDLWLLFLYGKLRTRTLKFVLSCTRYCDRRHCPRMSSGVRLR